LAIFETRWLHTGQCKSIQSRDIRYSADPNLELADGQWRSHTQITDPAWRQMAVLAISWPAIEHLHVEGGLPRAIVACR